MTPRCCVGGPPPDLRCDILRRWVGVPPPKLKRTVYLTLKLRGGTPTQESKGFFIILGGGTPPKNKKKPRKCLKMSYRSATDLSTSAFDSKFCALKAGDSPQTPKFDFYGFIEDRKILKFGGVPPHPRRIYSRC